MTTPHRLSTTIRRNLRAARDALEEERQNLGGVNQTDLPEDIAELRVLQSSTETKIVTVETRITEVEKYDGEWQQFIQELVTPAEHDAETEAYETIAHGKSPVGHLRVLRSAKDQLGMARLRLQKLNTLITIPSQPPQTLSGNGAPSAFSKSTSPVKLPPMVLPTFEGEAMQWQSFWQRFQAIVDTKPGLTDGDKMNYLDGCLKKTARIPISGLTIVGSNYSVAVELLKQQFELNPELIIVRLLRQLKQIRCPSAKFEDVQSTYFQVSKVVRQLEEAGENPSSNRSLAMDVLLAFGSAKSIVREVAMRMQFTAMVKSAEPDNTGGDDHSISGVIDSLAACSVNEILEALREFLKDYVAIDNLTDTLSPEGDSKSNKNFQPQRADRGNSPQQGNRSTGTVSSTFTSSSVDTGRQSFQISKPRSRCVFCGKNHFHRDYRTYPTLEERTQRINALKGCLRCLRTNHIAEQCRISPKCFNCRNVGHVSAICPNRSRETSNAESSLVANTATVDNGDSAKTASPKRYSSTPAKAIGKGKTAKAGLLAMMGTEDRSILSSAMVEVRNRKSGQSRTARLLFDSASSSSYITEELAQDIGLELSSTFLRTVATFANETTTETQCSKTELDVILKDGKPFTIFADVIPFITKTSITPTSLPDEVADFVNSMSYAMADNHQTAGPPDILLGNDYYLALLNGKPYHIVQNVYYLPTKLGIVLGGSFICCKSDDVDPVLLTISERPDYKLSFSNWNQPKVKAVPDLERFWDLESIGISDSPKDNSDDLAQEHFKETVKFINNRWEVGWPYNENIDLLPSNFGQAYGRFVSLARRLQSANESVRKQYDKIINEQIDLRIIEKVPPEEINISSNRIHYLSHHAVIKADHSTTKLRIVYDALAKGHSSAVSLNQCLHRGPVILPDLAALLLRFRLKPVAVIADIEKAFLQMSLRREDRDVTRFFWFKDPLNPNLRQYHTLRFQRIPFGVISSPSLLAQTIQHHLQLENTDTSRLIANSMYVDNCIVSLDSEDQALQFYNESKPLFDRCSMNLREWISNSDGLLKAMHPKDRSSKRIVKTLGLVWDSTVDSLQLNGDWSRYVNCNTKRPIVQAVASIFDPCGIYQPAGLVAKLLLRKLWQSKTGWDDLLDLELHNEWREVHQGIQPIFTHTVPHRLSRLQNCEDQSVVVFCDASADAFAACAYLRTRLPEHVRYDCSLIFAKSRVTPRALHRKTKQNNSASNDLSLPRLELLALLIGARMASFVKQALALPPDSTVTLFSDSTCVLSWLRSRKKLPIFVHNRVMKIRELENAEYRYVPSEHNAADICSRGTDGESLIASDFWWKGPEGLAKPKTAWPSSSEVTPITSTELQQITERSDQSVVHSFSSAEVSSHRSGCTLNYDAAEAPLAIDFSRFSSYGKLLKVTALCLQFLKRLWDSLPNNIRSSKPLLSKVFNLADNDETDFVSKLWIRAIQASAYRDILEHYRTKRKLPQIVKQLDIRLDDDGLLRCIGRLQKMELPYDAIYPILLHPSHHITRLIVKQVHNQCFHAGVTVNHTLNQLRLKYWIPKGPLVVRNLIRQCTICRKLKGAAFALPNMPNLPKDRVVRSQPFQFTGVDYLGPINIKCHDEKQKYWVAIFTCFTTRAIHLEEVPDCTTESFVNAISRFIARRGTPERMLSDNAPQFKLTKTLFDRCWNSVWHDPNLISYMCKHRIDWRFIIELAPWQGGLYERLVSIVKSLFRAEVGRRLLGLDEFRTFIVEIETIVNSRPITYVYSDIDSGVALRPIDFLVNLATGLPEMDPLQKPPPGEATKFLSRMWNAKERRLNALWHRWCNEYLLSLREQHRATHRQQHNVFHFVPNVNDIVVVHNEDLPRGCWKLARVTRLIVSNDRKIRAVELQLPNRQVIRRALNHIYPLEIPTAKQPANITSKTADTSAAEELEAFHGFDEEDVERASDLIRVMNSNDNVLDLVQLNISEGLSLQFPNRQ